MITQYSDANKVETTKQVVTYSSKPYVWSDSTGNASVLYYELTRKSSQLFKYVGMTKAAAETCAAAMRAEWTRQYAYWTANLVDSGETNVAPNVVLVPTWQLECQSSIQACLTDGSMWQTDVTVNESDVIISLTAPTTEEEFRQIFAAAEARDVPMSTGSIAILTAKWSGQVGGEIVIEYQQRITNYDRTKMRVQVFDEDTSAWTEGFATIAANGHTARIAADENLKLRMAYDSAAIVSDAFTSTGVAMPTMTIANLSYEEAIPETNSKAIATSFVFDVSFAGGWASSSNVDRQSLEFWFKEGSAAGAYTKAEIVSVSMIADLTYRVNARVYAPAPNTALGVTAHAEFSYLGQTITSNDLFTKRETFVDFTGDSLVPIAIDHEGDVVKLSGKVMSSFALTDQNFSVAIENWKNVMSGAMVSGQIEWKSVSASTFTLTQIPGDTNGYTVAAEFTIPAADEVFFRGGLYVRVSGVSGAATVYGSRQYRLVEAKPVAVSSFALLTAAPRTVTVQPLMTVESGKTVDWNWGDGSAVESGLGSNQAPAAHSYAAGTFTIQVVGHLLSPKGGSSLDPWIAPVDYSIIKSANLAWSVTSIGDYAFAGCTGMTRAAAENATSIGQRAFYLCTSLTDVSMPKATTLVANAFEDCRVLADAEFPKAATVGGEAFKGCSALAFLRLPAVETIGANAFSGLPATTVIALAGKTTYQVLDMANYPWGLASGSVVRCANGDVEVA